MALEDFFKKINFVENVAVPDGFGGWNTHWEIGPEFSGLVTTASETEQNTQALRGNLAKQYKVSVPTSVPLKKGDKIAFTLMPGGSIEYAEITSDGVISPVQAETQFKLYSAQSWEFDDE